MPAGSRPLTGSSRIEDRRVGEQRQGDPETLAHPGRIALGGTLAARRQVDQSERGGDPRVARDVRPAPGGRQDAQVLGSREVRVEDRGRDHRPDPLPGDPAPADGSPAIVTVPASARTRPTRMRRAVVLPAPFGPSRPTDVAFLDDEVEPIEGGDPPVSLAQTGRLDRRGHPAEAFGGGPPVSIRRRTVSRASAGGGLSASRPRPGRTRSRRNRACPAVEDRVLGGVLGDRPCRAHVDATTLLTLLGDGHLGFLRCVSDPWTVSAEAVRSHQASRACDLAAASQVRLSTIASDVDPRPDHRSADRRAARRRDPPPLRRVLRRARPHGRAQRQPRAGRRPDAALHELGHGPVQGRPDRRRDALLQRGPSTTSAACASPASTTTSRRSGGRRATTRSSRCSATGASATTSSARRSTGPGTS